MTACRGRGRLWPLAHFVPSQVICILWASLRSMEVSRHKLSSMMLLPGQVVRYRCPCCEAYVSAGAWHVKDRLTTFLVGESVLGWPKAARALMQAGVIAAAGVHALTCKHLLACGALYQADGALLLRQGGDMPTGRAMLDEALAFRGNLYFGAVGACCVGCAVWQRSFCLLPRWALSLCCLSLVWPYAVLASWMIVTAAPLASA